MNALAGGRSGSLCHPRQIEYAVYIAVPLGDDADRIATAAAAFAPEGTQFSIREHGDPSESVDAELFLRIRGVEDRDEALARALEIYEAGRREAGLRRDLHAQPSLVPLARPAGQ
ncbi:MAG: hypothetical protein ACOYD4_03210 [Solirubrobacterales bacterium]